MKKQHQHNGLNHYASSSMPGPGEVAFLAISGILLGTATWYVFLTWPDIDHEITARYYQGGFYYRDIPAAVATRVVLIWAIILFYVTCLWSGLKAFYRQKNVLGFPWHKWAYLGVTALAGPVLIINVLLKGNWGRARPHNVVEYGGNLDFTPFWIIDQQCKDNCSFASGETSGIAMIFVSLALLLEKKLRIAALVAGAVLTAFTSWLRVAMGAHFISDTVMAAAIVIVVAAITYYVFYIRKHGWFDRLNALQREKMEQKKRKT